MKKIALGSTNQHKMEAVRQACALLGHDVEVVGYKATSGEHEQPVGFEATCRGALHRAAATHNEYADLPCIGIESGILRFAGVTIDLAVIVIRLPDGETFVSTSPGISFPADCVVEAEQAGFTTTTVGSIIAKTIGGDGTDPHATLTRGRLSRAQTLVEGIRVALCQLPEEILA